MSRKSLLKRLRIHVFFCFFLFSLLLSGNTKTLVNTQKRGNRSACIQTFPFLLPLFLLSTIHQKKSKRWPRKTTSVLVHQTLPYIITVLKQKAPSQQPPITSNSLTSTKTSEPCSPIFSSPLEILKATTNFLLYLRPPPTRPCPRPQSSSLPRQQTRPAEPQR